MSASFVDVGAGAEVGAGADVGADVEAGADDEDGESPTCIDDDTVDSAFISPGL
jgi:hypothetical protein